MEDDLTIEERYRRIDDRYRQIETERGERFSHIFWIVVLVVLIVSLF